MRSLMFLLVLDLFCSLPMTSGAPLAFMGHLTCCGEFATVKVPVKLVKSYYWTSSSCPRRAIVFQMISGKEFCVDPEATWVNGHVTKVDKRTTTSTTKTTTSAATTSTITSAATTETKTSAATTETITSAATTETITSAATTETITSAATTATTAKTQSPKVSRNSTVPI